jgi:hypothetical protein
MPTGFINSQVAKPLTMDGRDFQRPVHIMDVTIIKTDSRKTNADGKNRDQRAPLIS